MIHFLSKSHEFLKTAKIKPKDFRKFQKAKRVSLAFLLFRQIKIKSATCSIMNKVVIIPSSPRSLILLGLFIFFQIFGLSAQQVEKYEVSIAGLTIGQMTAQKTEKLGEVHYQIKSLVSFWFFGKINLDYSIQSIYREGKLIRGEANSKTNRGDFRSLVEWNKDHYKVTARNYKYEKDTLIHKPMFFSSPVFYFEEPKNMKEFIAEPFGLPSPIRKRTDHYEVVVNGNKNRFYYVDGKLDKAVIEFPIKNYVVKRIQ